MDARPEITPPAPRWEWRTFAPSLAELRAKLPNLSDVQPKRSRETYVVCEASEHNAKIRFDVLDVKQLFETDSDGLELWKPVFKESFPIASSAIVRLFGIWRLKAPVLAREAYTLPQFLDEVVRKTRGLHAVEVEKTRFGFIYAGCIAEMAQVTFNGIPLETFCVEHEDRSLIQRARFALGLRSAVNVNYPQAIKETIGTAALPAA